MNKTIGEKIKMPSAEDSKVILSVLWQRGIIRINRDDLQCRKKIVELGLSMPEAEEACLIYGKEGNAALYLFVCLPNSNRERNASTLSIYGFRFDIAGYRRNPLPGLNDSGQAFLVFMGAVATVEGLI